MGLTKESELKKKISALILVPLGSKDGPDLGGLVVVSGRDGQAVAQSNCDVSESPGR